MKNSKINQILQKLDQLERNKKQLEVNLKQELTQGRRGLYVKFNFGTSLYYGQVTNISKRGKEILIDAHYVNFWPNGTALVDTYYNFSYKNLQKVQIITKKEYDQAEGKSKMLTRILTKLVKQNENN